MSGGAFDYLEFVVDSINSDLNKFSEFLSDDLWMRPEALKLNHKYVELSTQITKIMQLVNSIDTKFIHDVEWAESGDINFSDVVDKYKEKNHD